MIDPLTFFFEIPIKAYQRPRFGNGTAYNPERYSAYKREIAQLARIKMKEKFGDVIKVPYFQYESLAVTMSFNFQKKDKSTAKFPGRADLDNYCKAICDALNGIVWNDDRQIDRLYLCKEWTTTPGIFVTVYPVESFPVKMAA